MFVSLSGVQGACVNSGPDWLSHSAIPTQNAMWSWKFHVPAVPAWFGRTFGSSGRVSSYFDELPEPGVFE